jgi:hypothetical protein
MSPYAEKVAYSLPPSFGYTLPSKGRLKWFGGNLALDYPVCEHVLDDSGNVLYMGLDEVLHRLDEFEGERCGMPIKEWLIDMAVAAYKYKLLSDNERDSIEAYAQTIGILGDMVTREKNSLEAA